MASEKGQTAVVVPVPAAEPVVSSWRERFDDSAAQGMPAHITALYPFLPEDRLTSDVLARLRELCAEMPVLDVQFRSVGRFSEVLYLDPDPSDGLRRLTVAIAQQWQEAPPYGGLLDDVIPHLTVAQGLGDGLLDDIEADLARRLPVSTQLSQACVYVFDGRLWRPHAGLPFQRAISNRRNG